MWSEEMPNSRVPSLHGHYSASSLLRTHPPPSRRQPISRCCRLYGLPRFRPFGSGRGGFLQLLVVSLSPCRRSPPRRSDPPRQSVCDVPCCLRPRNAGSASGAKFDFGATTRSRLLRPGASRHPEDGFVDGFQDIGFPSCLPSQLRGFRLLPRQDWLLLNTTALPGHTERLEPFTDWL